MLAISWETEATVQLPGGGDAIRTTSEVLELDILITDTYDVAAKISAHAVEQGVDITDHTEPERDRVQAECAISARPMDVNMVEGSTMSATLAGGGLAVAVTPPEGTTRKADAFEELRGLVRNATLVDVEGLARPLENYQIEGVSAPRAIDDAGLLVVDITFVEHRTAEVEEVDVPSPRVERGRGRSNRGRQSTGVGAGAGGTLGAQAEGVGAGEGGTIQGQEEVASEPEQRSSGLATLVNMLSSGGAGEPAQGEISDDWQQPS